MAIATVLMTNYNHTNSSSTAASGRQLAKIGDRMVALERAVGKLVETTRSGTLRGGAAAALAAAPPATPSDHDLDSGLGAEDRAAVDELFDSHKCEHIYFDVGSNIGVQIRKVYEPYKYVEAVRLEGDGGWQPLLNATALVLFRHYFGPAPRCHVCSIGIEANPTHSARLDEVQRRLRAAGAGVLFFKAAAATNSHGKLEFNVGKPDDVKRFQDWGASAVLSYEENAAKQSKVSVRTLDLAALVNYVGGKLRGSEAKEQRVVGRGGTPGVRNMVMKLDIEGSEVEVVPRLLATGAFCALDGVFVEWHGAIVARANEKKRDDKASAMATLMNAMEQAFVQIRLDQKQRVTMDGVSEQALKCPARLVSVDDESYLHDPRPWPGQEGVCRLDVILPAGLPASSDCVTDLQLQDGTRKPCDCTWATKDSCAAFVDGSHCNFECCCLVRAEQ
eukprot:g1158.t1